MNGDRFWQAEDGRQLKALREAAGLDVVRLARLATVSVTQIQQLEDGGDSAFYSPAIKMATGRRVLHRLGVDGTVPGAASARVAVSAASLREPRSPVGATLSLFGPRDRADAWVR